LADCFYWRWGWYDACRRWSQAVRTQTGVFFFFLFEHELINKSHSPSSSLNDIRLRYQLLWSVLEWYKPSCSIFFKLKLLFKIIILIKTIIQNSGYIKIMTLNNNFI
jgi:hypothetical protein